MYAWTKRTLCVPNGMSFVNKAKGRVRGTSASNVPESISTVMGIRRSPQYMHEAGLQSQALSEHHLTVSAKNYEKRYKRKVLREEGNYEALRRHEEQCAVPTKKPSNSMLKNGNSDILFFSHKGYHDYVIAMTACITGYLTGHYVVYTYYGNAEEERLPYNTSTGFVKDIINQRQQITKQNDLIRANMFNA